MQSEFGIRATFPSLSTDVRHTSFPVVLLTDGVKSSSWMWMKSVSVKPRVMISQLLALTPACTHTHLSHKVGALINSPTPSPRDLTGFPAHPLTRQTVNADFTASVFITYDGVLRVMPVILLLRVQVGSGL